MSSSFKVVDIFAGPGGLAEGFSSYETEAGHRPFDIALSVEKDPAAFRTLRLRSFLRQFSGAFPLEYYELCEGNISSEALFAHYPDEIAAADRETLQLELGSEGAESTLDPLLENIRKDASPAILIGGPPCQAYSLVGRARNRGISGYLAHEDHRHFLYREYIRIIAKLQPAAFVMENVKGILSAKVNDRQIFARILEDLESAGGSLGSYVIVPLGVSGTGNSRYVLRSEDFGIPQNRHRVILLGIRKDLAQVAGLRENPLLRRSNDVATVRSVLGAMPALRSGLSKGPDGPHEWRQAVLAAFAHAADECDKASTDYADVAATLRDYRRSIADEDRVPPRSSGKPADIGEPGLAGFLADERLTYLPNNETRGHMTSDLARYAFAAVFAEVRAISPKAHDFPGALAALHRNWKSGKFADRFRVQRWDLPSSTITRHISKDGHYFIHPDPRQCRSLTVREAARLQTFPDNYLFLGNRTEQFVQVGNAVPPYLAKKVAGVVNSLLAGDGSGINFEMDRDQYLLRQSA